MTKNYVNLHKLKLAMDKVTYKGLTFEPYITHETIQKRINEIALRITDDYAGRCPLFLCVLTGAFPFAADLFRAVKLDAEISFVRFKSYDGTSTTGKVEEVMGLTEDLTGRDIIIVEDIIDTGATITKVIEDISAKGPASIKTATLLFKPEALQYDIKPHYVGFSIEPKFIIGFGLDLDGLGRNLRDIYQVTDG